MTDNYKTRLKAALSLHQGSFKRVLCVCASGCLRAPTAVYVLSLSPFNYNTRACGIEDDYAIVQLDDILLEWAQEIITFDWTMANELEERLFLNQLGAKLVIDLDIPDDYDFRDPVLMDLIRVKYMNVM